jgi:hypothetical protein
MREGDDGLWLTPPTPNPHVTWLLHTLTHEQLEVGHVLVQYIFNPADDR